MPGSHQPERSSAGRNQIVVIVLEPDRGRTATKLKQLSTFLRTGSCWSLSVMFVFVHTSVSWTAHRGPSVSPSYQSHRGVGARLVKAHIICAHSARRTHTEHTVQFYRLLLSVVSGRPFSAGGYPSEGELHQQSYGLSGGRQLLTQVSPWLAQVHLS